MSNIMLKNSSALLALASKYSNSGSEDEGEYSDSENQSVDPGSFRSNKSISSSVSGYCSNISNEFNELKPLNSLVSDDEEEDGVSIPPDPVKLGFKCPAEKQEKVNKCLEYMKSANLDFNQMVERKKEYRNPSMYLKLIELCDIDEYGTNFTPDRFDPYRWGAESYYEALHGEQQIAMAKYQSKTQVSASTSQAKDAIQTIENLKKRVAQQSLGSGAVSKKAKVTIISGAPKQRL